METTAYVIRLDGLHYWQAQARIWDTLNVATLYASREAATDHFRDVLHIYPQARPDVVMVTISPTTADDVWPPCRPEPAPADSLLDAAEGAYLALHVVIAQMDALCDQLGIERMPHPPTAGIADAIRASGGVPCQTVIDCMAHRADHAAVVAKLQEGQQP